MLAALFNEPPNFYVFIGFSLFCGTSIFFWVSRLPKAPVLSPRPWGLNISWVDFGLFLSTCFLAILLAQIFLSLIYKALDPPDAEPYSTPVIYNATFIGAGADGGSQVMKFRENTGGIYANSIFTGFEKGVDVDTGGKDGATIASGQDSEARFTAGDLALKANIYHDIAGASDIAGIVAIGDSDGANADFKSNFTSALTSAGSTFEDPQLAGISRVEGAALDPRPATDGPAYSGLTSLPADDVFYSSVSHKGAFGTADWTGSWSKTGASYTGDIFTPTADTVYVESNITADTIWSSFNTYVLTDIIYVTGDATLTIEAGTTIKGEPKSAGAFDPGTLVITQGSKIEAAGTAEAPIIFTSTEDDGSLTEADSGLWGGVILLGKAPINRPAGTEYIEGLPTSDLGIYGGDDAADNSGTLKYVSIRHGGAAIASDNEINGLTMGGVGSATTIEYVEVFANADDGFEWFGGTVNSKYLVGAFNNDDTFDWDEGFTGKGQFWFAIQAEGGDRGAEMDGGPSSADEFRKAILATVGMQGAILVCILILRNRYPKLFGDSMNRPDGLSAANAIPFSISAFIKFLPLLWIVTLLANIFLYMIGINPEQQKLVEMMREAAQQRPIQFAGLAFGAIILAPLAEETLFRGYIYRFLCAKSSKSNAALFSSLLFALIHFNLTSFAPLFFLSLLLTWAYEKTGNLLTPILFHAIFNAHTVGLILISPSLPEPNF